MVKVFVYIRRPAPDLWENEYHTFSRLPATGEYFARRPDDEWHRVVFVVHTPFKGEELAGEIYAEAVDHLAEMKRAFPG